MVALVRRGLTLVALAAVTLGAGTATAGADPVIAAAGDVSCDPGNAAFNQGLGTLMPAPGSCHEKQTSDLLAALAPTAVLALGDLQYEDGAYAKFLASYDLADGANNPISWGRAKAITRPVPGNHEYGAGNTTNGNIHHDANATGYFTYFADVLSPHGATATDPKKGYYSFDIPVGSFHWHLIALNSECAAGLAATVGWTGGCDAGSAQEQWLRADLAADNSDCTIAYWHHPLFSSGGIGNNPTVKPLWDALYADYADVVLSGHDHDYERFAPQDSSGVAAPGRGIREWVAGMGGRSLLALGTVKPNSELRDNSAYGLLKLTLHAPSAAHPHGWYEWVFVNDGNSGSAFADAGAANCVAPPDPPPPVQPRPTPPVTVGGTPATAVPKTPPRLRIKARVSAVAAGDVLKVRATAGTRRRYTVRLLGIKSPESPACGGRSARSSLRRLAFAGRRGRLVTLITDPTQPTRDSRGRLLAYVKRRDGVNLASTQLDRGWARVSNTSERFQLLSSFQRRQRAARRARRGAWRLCSEQFRSAAARRRPPSVADVVARGAR